MTIKQFTFSPFQENTYLVFTETGDAMIIDPGCYSPGEEENLSAYLTDNKLVLKMVANTHLHIDHLFGNRFLEEKYGIKCMANQADEFWINGLEAQAGLFGMVLRYEQPSVEQFISEGDQLKLGTEVFDVFEVPGHSPGSVAFYNALHGCVFSGDTLFAGSIGRTDLTGGDYGTLIRNIQDKLMTLPDDTVVYSGHGPSTTIGLEKQRNPYL